MKTYYHVFTDNKDWYFDDVNDAEHKYEELDKKGVENLRLYECSYEEDNDSPEETEEEDCLMSKGEFPR